MERSELKLQIIDDMEKRVTLDMARISPVLLKCKEEYTRIARELAPAIENFRYYQGMARPIIEQRLKAQKEFKEAVEFYTSRKEHVLISPLRRTTQIDEISCEEIASRVCELIQKDKPKKTLRATYFLPENASWGGLTIKFFDGHTVKVSYDGLPTKTFDYKDMGFVNNKTHNPDTKWEFLRAMADSGGGLTNLKFNRKFNRNAKYELSQKLKKFFGMTKDPIPTYTKRDGYKPLFTILSQE